VIDLGPHVPYDRDASEDAWRAALMTLMVWRFDAEIAPIGGVVVPQWDRYDEKHQQQVAVATRYVLRSDGHCGIAMERTFPLERAKTPLALYRAPHGRLEEIQRVETSPRGECRGGTAGDRANRRTEVRRASPSRTRRVVVLLAPLRPRRPTTRPGWTSRSMSSTATVPAKRRVRPVIETGLVT